MSSSTILSVLLLACTAFAQQEMFECPNPECTSAELNPCSNATCPRFTSGVQCCPEVLNGRCTASFYLQNPQIRRPLNPDLCFRNVEYCTPERCNEKRVCVEEVIPCTRPGCNFQAIKARCQRIEEPMPVVDCDQVSVKGGNILFVCLFVCFRMICQLKAL